MWYNHIVGYYSAVKRKEISIHATWINLKCKLNGFGEWLIEHS